MSSEHAHFGFIMGGYGYTCSPPFSEAVKLATEANPSSRRVFQILG